MATTLTEKQQLFFNPQRFLEPILLHDSIKMCFSYLSNNKRKYTVGNTSSMAQLLAEMITWVAGHVARFSSISSAREAIGHYLDINNAADLQNVLSGNEDLLKKANFQYGFISGVKKGRKGSKKEKSTGMKFYKHRRFVKDAERTIVMRSKLGNYPILYFPIKGEMNGASKEIINAKMEYRFQTGCPFFDARPVLMSTWLEFPEWRQNGTIRTEKVGDKWD